MLRFIRQYPVAGLLLALSVESWLALPGEAMIALAGSAVAGELYAWLRLLVGGVAGIVLNDLVLFSISRIGRGFLRHWLHFRAPHLHLSPVLMLGAKFLPPLRSAAYLIYGLQGTPLYRFLGVSLLSSLIWVCVYLAAGRGLRRSIGELMDKAEAGGRWLTVAEIGLTLALVFGVLV
ncbi:MAG: DedA family protein [Terriglobales bacterium]